MHPQLTLILAQQRTVDLRHAANRARLAQAAVNTGRRNPTPRVPISRRLHRRLANLHPAPR